MEPTSSSESLDEQSSVLISSIDHTHPGVRAQETRNLIVLACYQITIRIGWIFKTESIIMPAFLDSIGGAGWMRGCLPALNRLGQSGPPVLFADRLKRRRQKKWALMGCTMSMALAFGTISFIWFHYQTTGNWIAYVFLGLYALFFATFGINQLVLTTLQGKLIRPERRGRLMLISTTVGAALAILLASWLLMDWLSQPRGFARIFGFAASCFALASLVGFFFSEPKDRQRGLPISARAQLIQVRDVFLHDQNFRRLASVAMLFGTMIVLFPHYQALARQQFGMSETDLMPKDLLIWVIVQNTGTALFSLMAGPMADQRGNRLTLRWLILTASTTPAIALVLAYADGDWGRAIYPAVFVLIGLTPLTMRTLMNYTLELAKTSDHPKYVSTLSLCLALPMAFGPVVGLLVDHVGFVPVFSCGSALIALAGLLTFRLHEPRHENNDVSES